MRLVVGLLLALASALALNWGFFVQHGATSNLPALSVRQPLRSLRLLFANLRWLAGYASGLLGWGLYVAALHFAPLSIVQAVSAGGIGVLALLVHRFGANVLSQREMIAASVAVIGLMLLGASTVGHVPHSLRVSSLSLGLTVAAVFGAGALLLALSWRSPFAAFGLGAASGLCYAAGDIATKGALSGSGLAYVAVMLVCHALGFVALQLAFQRGGALATAGASTLLTNSVPIVVGVVLFRERLPNDISGVVRAVGFALVLLAAVLLASNGVEAPKPVASPSGPERSWD